MDLDILKWDDRGLISVIFQDHETDEVLVLGYMNWEALQLTLDTGKAHLFPRSLPLCYGLILGESMCCTECAGYNWKGSA
jgi:phosphoribosyl-AMP cyclohydrolase